MSENKSSSTSQSEYAKGMGRQEKGKLTAQFEKDFFDNAPDFPFFHKIPVKSKIPDLTDPPPPTERISIEDRIQCWPKNKPLHLTADEVKAYSKKYRASLNNFRLEKIDKYQRNLEDNIIFNITQGLGKCGELDLKGVIDGQLAARVIAMRMKKKGFKPEFVYASHIIVYW